MRTSIPWLPSLVLAAGLLACATAPSGPPIRWTDMPAQAPAAGEFRAIGEILVAGGGGGRSAAYDLFRVVGPTVNVTYTGNGTWSGTLDGRNFALEASPGKLSGAGVNLYVLQDGETLTIQGLWFQRQIWVTMSTKALHGHMAAQGGGFDLKRTSPNLMTGDWAMGGRGSVELRGEAVQFPNVVGPQFHLALLAALPP